MDAKMTGQQIAQLRKERGMTQGDLAGMLHVSVAAVSKWERGLNFPDLTILEPLADALDTNAADLLGLQNAPVEEVIRDMVVISEEHKTEAGFRLLLRCLLAMGVAVVMIPLGLWIYDSGFSTGLANVLWPLCFGILSWGLGFISLVSEKYRKEMTCTSWILCAVALYLPLMDVGSRIQLGDISGVIDTAWGWHQGAVVLLTGTILMTVVSLFMDFARKRK